MKKKTVLFFITFVIVICICLASIPVGGFVAGHDALTGQIVFFLSYYLAWFCSMPLKCSRKNIPDRMKKHSSR